MFGVSVSARTLRALVDDMTKRFTCYDKLIVITLFPNSTLVKLCGDLVKNLLVIMKLILVE